MPYVSTIVRGPQDLRGVRTELAAQYERHGLDDVLTGDILLAASELATNGLRHGQADHVKVESIVEPDRVELVLRHPDRAVARGVERSTGLQPGGRGLQIVDTVSTRRVVERSADDRTTRVSFDRR